MTEFLREIKFYTKIAGGISKLTFCVIFELDFVAFRSFHFSGLYDFADGNRHDAQQPAVPPVIDS